MQTPHQSKTPKFESYKEFDARVAKARRVLRSHGDKAVGSTAQQVSELMLNLTCLIEDTNEGSAGDFVYDYVSIWENYKDPKANCNVSVICHDLDSRKRPKGKERNVFISYGAEDAELVEVIGEAWQKPTKLGRSIHDDTLIKKVVDDALAKTKLCVVFGSPLSLQEEPSLMYLLRAARKRRVPTNIVSRSEAGDWLEPLKQAGVIGQGKEYADEWLSFSMYSSGSLNNLVKWIERCATRSRASLTRKVGNSSK